MKSIKNYISSHKSKESRGSDLSSSSSSGSSKFVLFPVATSVLDSNNYTLLSIAIGVSTVFIGTQMGYSAPLLAVSLSLIYILGIMQFQFGEMADFPAYSYQYNILLVVSALSIPTTIGFGYIVTNITLPILSEVTVGFSAISTWFINRRLYMTIKEDTLDLGYNASKSWLYVSRVPFIGVLTASLYASVSPLLWVGLMGYSTAAVFTYSIIRVILQSRQTNHNRKETSTKPDVQDTLTTDESNSNKEITNSDSSEEEITTHQTQQDMPENLRENYETAEEITLNLVESVDTLNQTLHSEGLSKYTVSEVNTNEIPPEIDDVRSVHKDCQKLAEYISDYEEDNRDLRRALLDVQQYIQELDEFIYSDINAPTYQ